jgi:poly(A) polymerase
VVPERLRHLVEETADIAERFDDAGKRLYLVGGIVRDALLGRRGDDRDLDFTTDALPDEIEAVVRGWADAVWTQGKRFGTIGCRKGDRLIEITTHRAEAYSPDSRKPTVRFSDAVEADLSRRDFTVNAMALRLPAMEMIDPFGGLADLGAGVLRTPLSPEESFSDDPLRMLRAARFIAGYGLAPEPSLVAAVESMADRLSIVSAERIREELDKLIVLERPGPGLWFLVSTGLAAQFLPELPGLALEQDPIHRHKDVLAHTVAVVERAQPHDDRVLRLSALFHDIGKPRTRRIGAGGVSFHHHEVVGARMTRERMTALRYSNDDIDAVVRLVELHLRFHGYTEGSGGWTDSAVRRYARDAGPLLDRLNALTRADCTTRNRRRAEELAARMDMLESRIAELREKEELSAIRPDLDGVQVMEHLGIRPGPLVGRALAFLLELRMDEGPLGLEEAYRRLDKWWAEQDGAAGSGG